MTKTTNVEQVKLNIMTTSQYDNSSKSDTELYVLTDATAMPMDDELSLSSENPVKNNVITARSNAIQVELDDKLNKSIVWNKLNRAYGWTYRHLNGSGNAYLLYYTTTNGWAYSDAISAQSVVEHGYPKEYESPNNSNYICLDNQLYYRTWTTTNGIYTFTLLPMGTNKCTHLIGNIAIIDNNLYYLSNSSLILKDSGGWTKITYCSTDSSTYAFGIKNDNLYFVSYLNSNNPTITLKDSGTWSDVVGWSSSASRYGFGIKEGKLYAINSSGITKISDETGWSICGIDTSGSNDTSFALAIKNGALYSIKGNGTIILIDNTETWIKVRGFANTGSYHGAALTQSGKLYRVTSINQITQIGTDSNWTDFSGTFYAYGSSFCLTAIKNGDVYVFSTTDYTPSKITNFGNITKVYDGCYMYNGYVAGIFWTGSVTEDVHSVYTVASPAVGFNTYSNTNLQQLGIITAESSSPYTITDQLYTYTRDASIDGVFTGISSDSSKQLMSMKDFLNCFTE